MCWALFGILGGNTNTFIDCGEDGYTWEYTSMWGDIFPTLHVAAVIMHAVIVVIVFYRFPKQAHYPDNDATFIYTGPNLPDE